MSDVATGKRRRRWGNAWNIYLSVQTQEEDHEEEEDKPEVGTRQHGQSLGVSNERQARTCTKRKERVDQETSIAISF